MVLSAQRTVEKVRIQPGLYETGNERNVVEMVLVFEDETASALMQRTGTPSSTDTWCGKRRVQRCNAS